MQSVYYPAGPGEYRQRFQTFGSGLKTRTLSGPVTPEDSVSFGARKPRRLRAKLPLAMMFLSTLALPMGSPINNAAAQQTGTAQVMTVNATGPVQFQVQPQQQIEQNRESFLAMLQDQDDELVAAAVLNLAEINERRAIPRIRQILRDGTAEPVLMEAALRALSRYAEQGTDADRRAFSQQILPYTLKVVVETPEGSVRYMPLEKAQAELKAHPEYKIKDLRSVAARVLGPAADGSTIAQLSRAAQNPTLDTESRLFMLEALKHTPPDETTDQHLLGFLNLLNVEEQPDLAGATASVLISHNAPGIWERAETLLIPHKPGGTVKDLQGKEAKADARGLMPFQKQIIETLMRQKQAASAPLMSKLMATYPDHFLAKRNFMLLQDYYRAMPAEIQKGLFNLLDPGQSETLARSLAGEQSEPAETAETKNEAEKQAPDKSGEAASPKDTAQEKARDVIAKIASLRQLSLSMAASLQMPDAAAQFPEIFSDKTQTPQLRHIAMVGSALLKDKAAVNGLMQIATDDMEDPGMRYDALSAVFEILTPPLAEGLTVNTTRIKSLQRYLSIYSQNPQLTQSFYQAELFEEIRTIQKELVHNNASPATIEDATEMVLEKKLKELARAGRNWASLKDAPEFQKYQREMVEYVSRQDQADGFLRVLMVNALGELKNPDIKPTLEELVRDPLIRTQIPEMATCDDILNFPGYTRSKVAETTRLAAVQALGNTGAIESAELVARGLRSDNRRLHLYVINALSEMGKATQDSQDPEIQARRAELSDRILKRLPKVSLDGSDRLDNYFKKLYVEAADHLGAGPELLKMLEETSDTVLQRTIAHGFIRNGHYLDHPQVNRFLPAALLGMENLHERGIDGRGTEIAIIDGDYINDDVEGLEGKVVYPEWGKTHDGAYRESFHGESVASAIAGRLNGVNYGVAPGVEKIHSYATWEDDVLAEAGTPVWETDGMIRAVDDIIRKRLRGESNVSVVNISMGGSAALLYGDEATVQKYLEKLAARFEAGSRLGITFVISAGNEQGDQLRHYLMGTLNALGFNKVEDKLSENKGVVLVGATDMKGTQDRSQHAIAWFSSLGDAFNETRPDITSLGSYVLLASRDPDGAYGIDEMDGTSFSSPITAGAILLMNQANGKPLDAGTVEKTLAETADPLKDTPEFMQGPGEMNIDRAVDQVLRSPAK